MKFLYVSLGFLLLLTMNTSTTFGQVLPSGAEAAGVGFATVSLDGKMGVWRNPAGLAKTKSQQLMVGCQNRYGLAEGLNTVHAAYIHPMASSVAAVSFYRMGDAIYSHHVLGLSLGHRVNQFQGGLRINQHQFSMEGADTRYALSIDAGVVATLSSQLGMGIQINNVNRAKVSNQTDERIPTQIAIGFDYKPDKQINVLGELAYEISSSPFLKVGMTYQPLPYLTFRSGVNTSEQARMFLGFGLRHRVLHLDYALETHPVLGISQHFGLAYQIRSDAE